MNFKFQWAVDLLYCVLLKYNFLNLYFRSSRIKDQSQRNPDEVSSENEDQSNADGTGSEKTSKLKIRTRTSSRNSPALLDSPKVVCDVSEDNPTKIKIHIETKSPEKAPLTSPVIANKTDDVIGVLTSNEESNKMKDTEGNDKGQEEPDNKNKDDTAKVEEVVEKVQETLVTSSEAEGEKIVSGEDKIAEQLPLVNEEKTNEDGIGKEQEENAVVVDTSEIVIESVETTEIATLEVVGDAGIDESKSDGVINKEPIRRSSSSHSLSPR